MSYENNAIEFEEEQVKSTNNIIKAAIIALLIIAGMAGLFFQIEYSGWVLAVGLIGAIDL